MAKIKITERELKNIISESVKKIMSENSQFEIMYRQFADVANLLYNNGVKSVEMVRDPKHGFLIGVTNENEYNLAEEILNKNGFNFEIDTNSDKMLIVLHF